jgi:trk system potassium uptake protein TrkA
VKKFAVIGLGQFGYQVAISLAELGAEVLAVDIDPSICEQITRVDRINPICLDATDEIALRATGIEDVEAAIVAIGQHLEVSILVTAILRRVSCRRIISRASSDLHAQILTSIGATQVCNPEQEMGIENARVIFAPDLRSRMQLPTGHYMAEIDTREPLWGKTIGELDFRARFELNVIAVKKRRPYVDEFGESRYTVETNLLPSGTDAVDEGDILVVIGRENRINDFLTL